MIGNISFGISFENGKRRVPIPPAVIKAVYPSKPFDDPVSSIDSMVRPLTRGVPNRWRGTRPTSTSCFQLGYNNGYVRCFEHMRIHGEYVPNVLPSRERTIWGGAGSLGARSPRISVFKCYQKLKGFFRSPVSSIYTTNSSDILSTSHGCYNTY